MKTELLTNKKDNTKRLFVSRVKENKRGAFSPCDMTPDDVDYEMSFNKDRNTLEICGMNQKSFEYFIEKYGESYESLQFFKCQLISDFSPLAAICAIPCVPATIFGRVVPYGCCMSHRNIRPRAYFSPIVRLL